MLAYQKRDLSDVSDVGEPGALPADLVGLAAESLANLDWTYEPLGYQGFGFFPVEVADPPPPVPEAVTQLQFRRALRQAGIKSAVDSYIAGQDEETVEAWEFASMIRRDSPLLNGAATAMYGAEEGREQLDTLFYLAATIVE